MYFVGHVELTTHLVMALLLLAYTLWFALKLKVNGQRVNNTSLQRLVLLTAVVLLLQLIYGGFMAGLRAAVMAPTWPDINGYLVPSGLQSLSPVVLNFFNNAITIHFIHRGIAYLLCFLVVFGFLKSRKIKGNTFFNRIWSITLLLMLTQVILGALTVLNAIYAGRLLWFGVAHQFVAILLVITVTCLLFITRRQSAAQ